MSLGNFITKKSYVDMDYVYGTLCRSGGENPLDYTALRDNPMKLSLMAQYDELSKTAHIIPFQFNEFIFSRHRPVLRN